MSESLHVCKNCSSTFSGNFCNHCGQKPAHRITMGHVSHDLLHVFLHADKGVFHFTKRLIVEPGVLARSYVDGKRKIFNPFQYLIFSVAIMIFLMTQSHFYEHMDSYNTDSASKLPPYFQKAMADFNFFVKKYANAITLATLPVYALFSWLFFKKRGFNYAEHITLFVFAYSLSNTITALVFLLFMLFSVSLFGTVAVSMVITVIALCLVYKQFFPLKWPKAIGMSIAVYCISYIVQILLMGIGLFIYVWIVKTKQ